MAFYDQVTEKLRQVLPEDYFYPKELLEKEAIKEIVREGLPIPSCAHYHEDACLLPQLQKLAGVMKNTSKLYFLAHLIPVLLFKRKNLKNSPGKTIFKLITGWMRSMAFIGQYGFICRKAWCKLTEGGKMNIRSFYLWSMLSCTGILYESSSRRPEICMYVVPKFLESVVGTSNKLKLFPNLPMASNGFFALAMGLIAYCYFEDENSVKPMLRGLVKLIFGQSDKVGKPQDATVDSAAPKSAHQEPSNFAKL